jgi:hypothetical protein
MSCPRECVQTKCVWRVAVDQRRRLSGITANPEAIQLLVGQSVHFRIADYSPGMSFGEV